MPAYRRPGFEVFPTFHFKCYEASALCLLSVGQHTRILAQTVQWSLKLKQVLELRL